MSLLDEDEPSSECVDMNNNNVLMMSDEDTFSNGKESMPGDEFYRELFNVYDIEQVGFIRVENFIEISKQNMFDSFLGDENKLMEFVGMLDPKGVGKIEYFEFVEGMTSLMSNKTENFMDGQELISRSRNSTFMEGEAPVLQTTNNLTEEIFENFSPETPNSSNKTSSNEYDYAENDAESLNESNDFFGIDSSVMKNHRKSLSIRKSISMGGIMRSSKRLSMHNQIDSDLLGRSGMDEDLDENNNIVNSSGKYERIIEGLENKIKNVEQQNENLKFEINEQIIKSKFQTGENTNLILKIREFEDLNSEIERKYNEQIYQESNRHQDLLNKTISQYDEDKENFLTQIRNLEALSQKQQIELTVHINKIDEMTKINEDKDLTIIQNSGKLKELQTEYKKSMIDLEQLTDEQERLKLDYDEQIDQLKKELQDLNSLLDNAEQEQMYQRKSTLYDESYYLNQIKQLETENKMFKTEVETLNTSLLELNANLKIYTTNKNDNDSISDVFNKQDSFMCEMTSQNEDELLEKLISERKNTQRLREYVEELTSKILEHNPSLLETKPRSNSTSSPHDATTSQKKSTFSYKRLLKLVN